MELIWYSFLLLLAVIFNLSPNIIKKEKSFFWLWFLVAIATSFIVRTSGLESDMVDYAILMKVDYMTPYYLREPLVWFSHRYIYTILNDEILTIIVTDIVSFILLYKAIKLQTNYFSRDRFGEIVKVINVRYAYFSLFLFYPYLVGFQVTYRQYFAEIIILCAIGYMQNNKISKGFFLFLLAVLSHNVAFFSLPIIIFFSKIKFYKIISIAALLISPIIMWMSITIENDIHIKKSNIYIGENIDELYIALFAFIFFIFVAANLINKHKKDIAFIVYGFVTVFMATSTSIILSSGTSERFAIFFLALIYIPIVIFVELRISNKVIVRSAIIAFLTFLPLERYTLALFSFNF